MNPFWKPQNGTGSFGSSLKGIPNLWLSDAEGKEAMAKSQSKSCHGSLSPKAISHKIT